MEPMQEEPGAAVDWPPQEGQTIRFKSSEGLRTAVLRGVRWGLVWRDFILEDGRIVPEHKVIGCPHPPVWRDPSDVTSDEREVWEERLVSMSEAGVNPRDREQSFWAELNQYLAYTYLRFQRAGHVQSQTSVSTLNDEFPQQIRDVKRVVSVRLHELLACRNDFRERESAAYSLGTLKKLETALFGLNIDGLKIDRLNIEPSAP
jgi:hypothetical protein